MSGVVSDVAPEQTGIGDATDQGLRTQQTPCRVFPTVHQSPKERESAR